jgi:hypothetical protein
METTIEEMLAAAEKDLAEKLRQRDRLNVAIIQAEQQVGALRSLAHRNILQKGQALVGLTEAIRSVLRLRDAAMTAGEVKNALDLLGYNFGGVANPSAAVHNTLKRMADTKELEIDESKAYRMPRFHPAMVAAMARRKK